MQIKNFLICLMVYLVPVCLDAQTSKNNSPNSAIIKNDSSTVSDSFVKSSDSLFTSSDNSSATSDIRKNDEQFEIFLLLIGSIGVGIMLMCIGIGVVVTAVAFMILAGFISMGVITSSIYIGLRKRSVSKGANAFIMICSSLFGIVSGGISTLALNTVYSWTSTGPAIATGVVAGLMGGLILGFFITRILTSLINFTDKKFRITAR